MPQREHDLMHMNMYAYAKLLHSDHMQQTLIEKLPRKRMTQKINISKHDFSTSLYSHLHSHSLVHKNSWVMTYVHSCYAQITCINLQRQNDQDAQL